MGRWLRWTLLALPWVLLLLMGGFAAIGWLHFIAKDEALWERTFADTALATEALSALEADAAPDAERPLRARLDEACDYLVRYRDHLPPKLADAHAAALARCPAAH